MCTRTSCARPHILATLQPEHPAGNQLLRQTCMQGPSTAECALAQAALVRTYLQPCSLNILLATSYCAKHACRARAQNIHDDMQFAMTRREKAEKRREERKRKREAEEASAKAAKAGSKPAADTGKPANAGATGAEAKPDTGGKRPAPEAGDEGEPSPAKRVKTEDAATEVCFCGINHHDTTSMQLSSVLGIGITADRGWVTLQLACRLSTWQLTKWNCQRVSPAQVLTCRISCSAKAFCRVCQIRDSQLLKYICLSLLQAAVDVTMEEADVKAEAAEAAAAAETEAETAEAPAAGSAKKGAAGKRKAPARKAPAKKAATKKPPARTTRATRGKVTISCRTCVAVCQGNFRATTGKPAANRVVKDDIVNVGGPLSDSAQTLCRLRTASSGFGCCLQLATSCQEKPPARARFPLLALLLWLSCLFFSLCQAFAP